MRGYLLIGVISAIITAASTWLVWKIGVRYRLYPEIRARDVHTRPTPRLGGVAIFIAFALSTVVASRIGWFQLVFDSPQMWAVVAGAAFVCILGVTDDLWDLDWFTKLAGQILVAWWLAWQGFQIVSLPIGGVVIGSGIVSLLLTMLLIVLVMNAINFIDGLDGLVTGVVMIACSVFFIYSYLVAVETSPNNYFNTASLITAILVGATLGFLPFNWHPAKIFLGDSGALQLGMLMSTAAISVTGQVDPAFLEKKSLWLPTVMPIVVPLAILIVPLLDFTMAVVRRLRAGKSPFAADRKHLHHRMLDMGHGVISAVVVFYCWTALFSVSSLLLMFVRWQDLFPYAVAGFALCILLTYRPLLMKKWRRRSHEDV